MFLVVIIVWEGFVNEDGAGRAGRTFAREEVLYAPVRQLVVPAHEAGAFCGGGHRRWCVRLSLSLSTATRTMVERMRERWESVGGRVGESSETAEETSARADTSRQELGCPIG